MLSNAQLSFRYLKALMSKLGTEAETRFVQEILSSSYVLMILAFWDMPYGTGVNNIFTHFEIIFG